MFLFDFLLLSGEFLFKRLEPLLKILFVEVIRVKIILVFIGIGIYLVGGNISENQIIKM
jgi:hypothetical protein